MLAGLTAILAITLLIGAALLTLGLRGRRINDHPICRRCEFDLVGVYPDADRCPECGRELDGPRQIRTGQRRRGRKSIAIGLLLLLVPVLSGAAFAWSAWRGVSLYSYAPDWYLIFAAGDDPADWGPPLGGEFLLRIRSRELSARAGEILAERTTAHLTSSEPVVKNPISGELHQELLDAGLLTTSQIERSLHTIRPFEEVRPRCLSGGLLAVDNHDYSYAGADGIAMFGTSCPSIKPIGWRLAGHELEDVTAQVQAQLRGGAEPLEFSMLTGQVRVDFSKVLRVPDLPPGSYELEYRYEVGMHCVAAPRDGVLPPPGEPTVVTEVVHRYPVEVFPAGTNDDLILITDGEAEERILEAMRRAARGGIENWEGRFRLESFPTNLLAELWVVKAEYELPVGAVLLTERFDSPEDFCWRVRQSRVQPRELPQSLEGARLVLRPRLDYARLEQDIQEVWGKEVSVPLE